MEPNYIGPGVWISPTEQVKPKTALITPSETGQFERLVFGLVNPPYEFSRLMQYILQHYGIRWPAMCCLDDILIPAISFEILTCTDFWHCWGFFDVLFQIIR